MFAKLFGGKKEDPEKKKEIEKKKDAFETAQAAENVQKKIDENQIKIEVIERNIRDKTKVVSSVGVGCEEGKSERQSDETAY